MKVLIAEDDKNFGRVLSDAMRENGYDVDHAVDGLEAVLKFIDKKYDFVLLDIKMPRLDGINALQDHQKTESRCAGHDLFRERRQRRNG